MLEDEFTAYKAQMQASPEAKLRAELAEASVERTRALKKVETAEAQKRKYKQQWNRALQEIAHLKSRAQAESRARALKDQRELEHMRLRYLASEEKDLVRNERQELSNIKTELMSLRAAQLDNATGDRAATAVPDGRDYAEFTSSGARDYGSAGASGYAATPLDTEIRRLVDERDGLLKTGVYTPRDRIIVELDRQIAQCQRKRGHLL